MEDDIQARSVSQVTREKFTFKRPTIVYKENVNDGYSASLGIFKPKPSISEIPDWIKENWFRDPNSRQWISRKQVEKRRTA